MKSQLFCRRAVIGLLLAASGWAAQAERVQVAVAANFAAPMQAIAAAFERSSGHTVLLSVGSTGKFYAQIKNGAPFHVLLAADAQTPARLEQEGLGVVGSRFTYARGRLVLWSSQPGVVDAQGAVLRSGNFAHLALADPKLAPYGAAALEVLQRLGVLAHWRAKLVQGENIAQAYQFVATGNAELGFVALSQVRANGGSGSYWLVPAEWHEPLQQDAVLLKPGQDTPAAQALLAYLRSEAARTILLRFGYELPPP